MRFGIVICTRSDSSRIPKKPFQLIKGKPLIHRLVEQLLPLKIPICIATPKRDRDAFEESLSRFDVLFYSGQDNSPLHRTEMAAFQHNFSHIIRITHDKIFIDKQSLRYCMNLFRENDFNYIFSSHLIDGSGFEIFTYDILNHACRAFDQDIEHISYAIKSVTPRMLNYNPQYSPNYFNLNTRMLIDFEEDLEFIKSIYAHASCENPNLDDALLTLKKYPYLIKINKQPKITVYTCAYNEENYIESAIESVVSQTIFKDIEYIIIDDASTDKTYEKIISSRFFESGQIKVKRNEVNLGLSSSSNIALNIARGKYILRLDADDALLFPFILEKMLTQAQECEVDALYPLYIDDKSKMYKSGKDIHHVGGCLFLTKTIRNIQFTEKLRGWEGLDLFERSKDQIKIGYYEDLPAFFYRNKPDSMSKTNEAFRESIRQQIAKGKLGNDLIGAPI